MDVLVVGAGPAGSSVAKHLAEKGAEVLIIEKRQEIGAPKRCGEGLSRSALERMGLEPDPKWICQEIQRARVYAPNGKSVTAEFDGPEGWVIERKVFDKELAKLAVEAGAQIRTKTELLELERDRDCWRVKTNRGEERPKVLVAADGVESQTARLAGLNTTLELSDIASCAQFELSGIDIDPEEIRLYFGRKIAPGGYVWVFPKGKRTANVGVGVRRPFAEKPAINYLQEFVEKAFPDASVLEVNAGGVPVGGLMKDMVLDGFLAVGDAAHQVNPIHGGGIAEAWVAGRIAAEVIAEALKHQDWSKSRLNEYNRRWWKERGEKLEKLWKLRKVVESLTDDDLNWLADQLSGEDLVELARASKFKLFASILVKRPKLAILARKLF